MGGKGGADAPARRHDKRGLDGDVADRRFGGVEQKLFPLQYGKFLREAGGHDAVQMGVQGGGRPWES